MPRTTRLILLSALLPLCLPAAAQDLSDFKAEIGEAARDAGVSSRTIAASLNGFQPIERVIELDHKQPEHTITFDTYIRRVVSDSRIERGQVLVAQNRALLDRIEQDYGVPPSILVALWGAESSFGSSMGDYHIIPALATLSYEGRRHDFFKSELIKAMQIVDAGDVTLDDMTGSWAGAMGQVQFMPSTFLNYAVDYTGTGHRDIWHSDADALASGANFLQHLGWKRGEKWGREVVLPSRFNEALARPDNLQTVSTWASLGLKTTDGSDLPESDIMASVVLPDGIGGRAFLAYGNFRVIMRWNHSNYFATSIGLLSDAIEGRQ